MADSKIEWTDAVWNPVTGCTRVSAGCDNCYAVTQSHIRGSNPMPAMQKKYAGLTVLNKAGDRHFNGKIRTHDDALEIPLHWKKPRRIFVNSMSDLFHKDVPFEFVDKVFAVVALCPQHTFQILTKRPERMAEYLNERWQPSTITPRGHGRDFVVEQLMLELAEQRGMIDPANDDHFTTDGTSKVLANFSWPLRNVWLGTSVEDQPSADKRVPELLKCNAAVRFLSCEPLLGPLDLEKKIGGTRWIGGQRGCGAMHHGIGTPECPRELHHHHDERCKPGIDWVIVGGESGHSARPMHPDWPRSIRDQCAAARVPFFFKQWGEWAPVRGYGPSNRSRHHCFDGPSKATPELSEYNGLSLANVFRFGKKAAGRLLDGVEHNAMPATTMEVAR